MEKFSLVRKGYNPTEVNEYFDKVIENVEILVNDLKVKNARIKELESVETENQILKEKLEQYMKTENSLNTTILLAQRTSDQIKISAQQEKELILEDARKSASRIVNDSLLRAEKIEYDSRRLQKNVDIFKRRLRDILEAQLSMVEEIDKDDL